MDLAFPAAPPLRALRRADLDADPMAQFARWFAEWRATGALEPTAMALATADLAGQPSVRMVLMKDHDARGFTFFTNAGSRKGRELAANPLAALLFHWPALDRQVRVEGPVKRVIEAESDAYFRTRALGSQLAAWASPQSAPIADRAALDARLVQAAARVSAPDESVPRPPHWGGFRVRPELFEFWQGRPERLHDRFQYRRAADGAWAIARLAP